MVAPVKRFHTTTKLGPKRELTPDGFLVCLDVPMARTGEMYYGPDETPVKSADGASPVRIRRDAEDIFNQTAITSIIGKPVVIEHPDENVTPDNHSDLAVGHVVNARRGEGAMADLLLGDIMITDKDTIKSLEDENPEVSCGYDADYEELEPGVGRQKNIIYNHLALVEKGRCGPRCAIGDYQPPQLKEIPMAGIVKTTKRRFLDRLHGIVKDAEELEKEITGDDTELTNTGETSTKPNEVHIHLSGGPEKTSGGAKEVTADDLGDPAAADPMAEVKKDIATLQAMVTTIAAAVQKLCGDKSDGGDPAEGEVSEDDMAEEAPANFDAKSVKDSAPFQDSFQDTIATAEIIVPGVRVPTFDSKSAPKKTIGALCSFRRTVLDLAYVKPETRAMMDTLNGGRTVDTKCMTCDKVRGMFRSLGVLRRQTNNDRHSVPTYTSGGGGRTEDKKGITSIADLNAHNATRFNKKSA